MQKETAHSKTTDTLLRHLSQLGSVKELHLVRSGVTDDDLIYFAGLRNLRVLDLRVTDVTEEGITALQEALPSCKMLIGPDVTID